MGTERVETIESEFKPKDADAMVGEASEAYLLDCEPCPELRIPGEGVAGMDFATGTDLLNAVVDAIADRDGAARYLLALDADLRGRCGNSAEKALAAAIVLAAREKRARK